MKNNVTSHSPFTIQHKNIYLGTIFYAWTGKGVRVCRMSVDFELTDGWVYFIKSSEAHLFAKKKGFVVSMTHPLKAGTKVKIAWKYMYNFHKNKTFEILSVAGNKPLQYKVKNVETGII